MCLYSSHYDPVQYNGTEDTEEKETSEGAGGKGVGGEGDQNLEKFSFSDLPRLDYGTEDEREEREPPSGGGGGAMADEHSRDQMALALRELGASAR